MKLYKICKYTNVIQILIMFILILDLLGKLLRITMYEHVYDLLPVSILFFYDQQLRSPSNQVYQLSLITYIAYILSYI